MHLSLSIEGPYPKGNVLYRYGIKQDMIVVFPGVKFSPLGRLRAKKGNKGNKGNKGGDKEAREPQRPPAVFGYPRDYLHAIAVLQTLPLWDFLSFFGKHPPSLEDTL